MGKQARETGHRERMRDHCVIVHRLLSEHSVIPISEIARELGCSNRTAKRWVDAFTGCFDLRIERSIVIVINN